jgi:cytoskeletal protein CcmA (bactofilin family)
MKRIGVIIGILAALVLSFFVFGGVAGAHSFRTGSNVTVTRDEKIDHTLFAAGRNIDIAGEVMGDVICAGQTISISGNIHGDVICAGQSVHISGGVDGDVRVAGQTITLSSAVAGNATVAGQTFTLESSGKIGGDISLASSDATLNGSVGRDVAANGSTVTLAGNIGRDVRGNIANLALLGKAKIGGDVDYRSNNDAVKDSGVVIGGKITRTNLPKHAARRTVVGFTIMWFLYWLAAMLLVALVLALVLPRLLHSAAGAALLKPWKALLTGFVAGFVVPALIILSMLTVVGIPLGFIIGLLWLVVVLFSGPVFGYYLGRLIMRDSHQPLLIMLVGSAILLVLYFIPIVGFFAVLAALWMGSGMILLEAKRRLPKPVYSLATTPATGRAKK